MGRFMKELTRKNKVKRYQAYGDKIPTGVTVASYGTFRMTKVEFHEHYVYSSREKSVELVEQVAGASIVPRVAQKGEIVPRFPPIM